jgi:hypothetical protein
MEHTMTIALLFLILAAVSFVLAAIGRPAWPWLPIGLLLITLALIFNDASITLH